MNTQIKYSIGNQVTNKLTFIYNGKQCAIINRFRTRRAGTTWGYHNILCLRYADGTSETVPAGKFHASAKTAQEPA